MARRKNATQATAQASAPATQLVELASLLAQLNPAEIDTLTSVVKKQLATHQPTADVKPAKAAKAKKPTASKPQTREEALTAKYGDKDARIAYLKAQGRYNDPSRKDDFDKAWSNYVAHCKSKGVTRTKDLNRKVAAAIRANGYAFTAKLLNA